MEPLATVADGEKQRKYVQHDTLAVRIKSALRALVRNPRR
jgi:hypothetical protein